MDYQLITTDDQLKLVCERAAQASRIALDTEFVRTRTYYPQLGLIQLYDGEQVTLIDPLNINDWSPFTALLINPNVIKLLHACSEDLEVFLHEFGILPQPLIDTQILAAFNQRSLSTGFATLVAEYLHVELDKSESRTDWLARPLTEKQCVYAAADVYYLLPIADVILKETEQLQWLTAAQNECVMMSKRRSDVVTPEQAYLDVNNGWQLNGRQLACLKLLAAWRLNYARERDMAVNFVVREENLWQVARYLPTSLAELEPLGLSGPEIRFHGRTLLRLVTEALSVAEDDFPPKILRIVDHPGYKKLFKDIKSLIQTVSAESGLNVELLASRRQINQVLKLYWQQGSSNETAELLQGWRGELMGERLKALLEQEAKPFM
ncbi:ribonuclease D [Pragia fontium]|uniref:Ribonuclease D n=2 Tax=Pragia fontium TaxID=82985 RepID=A0AAJ5BH69_9GAMM|nr:ribonuclease D [Pragia fontium]GKX61544.1 ribonuclease D [Pragia fontium]SFC80666.1 ribonuclease D [Pragia fontium DSM 5563 = ATCC 49100]